MIANVWFKSLCCSLEEKTQAIYGLQFLKMGAKENKPGEIWAEA